MALCVGLTTCGPGHGTDCLKSTGTIVTQRREVGAGLEVVTAFDNVDLHLVQDSQTYAEVRAGENLISDIVFTRKGNALEISNTSTCNWARSYDTPREVTLHLPRVKNVFLRGQGNVSTSGQFVQDTIFFHLVGAGDYALNVKANMLFLDLYELGDVVVQGSAEEMNFNVGGSGRLFAQGFGVKRCYFKMLHDSDGDAHVHATQGVGGTVAGNGTFYYSGSPSVVDLTLKGNGKARTE
ncbi:GIN domain-containing protein [Hymenobacter rubidus]|uniref:GIN domain-containing protein n=1 Tax=Hymenobacter rubidus TaxID=1441626 RepID=UPI00191D64C2|nr:DUF2807 domain-containing protein [Hymenobacter rubidus]